MGLDFSRRHFLRKLGTIAVCLQAIITAGKSLRLMARSAPGTQKPKGTVEARVKRIIIDLLGVPDEQVVPSARFIEDLGADSLDVVEILMAFEEEFKIEITDEDAKKIKTVKQAIDYLKLRTKK